MTIPDYHNYSIFIISLVYTLCYALTFIFAYWKHTRKNPATSLSMYLINLKSILIYFSGLILTLIAMSEFIPYQEQRLKIFGLLLLLTSFHYLFNTLFYRIDIQVQESKPTIGKIEEMLKELDNQTDKIAFAEKIFIFLKKNHAIDNFMMLEVTEDIIPFAPVYQTEIEEEMFKQIKINHAEFYSIMTEKENSRKNILPLLDDNMRDLMIKCNIMQIRPFIHHNTPIAVLLFGSNHPAGKKELENIDWHSLVIQCAPRFELIRLVEREINAQKMAELGVMSSQLAHDFKSFLAMINLYMEDNPIITRHVQYMNKLVKDLSAYARSATSEKTRLNINEIIDISLESTPIPENIIIDKQLDNDVPASMVDPHQMQRIFQNLIENSIRAMPEGGQIKVSTRTLRAKTSNNRPWVYIEFKDEGPGIPEENLQKIFEPFYTTYKKQGGTGMGLAISRQIIMHHQGFIDVTSKIGKGTIFNIRLPGIVGEQHDQ